MYCNMFYCIVDQYFVFKEGLPRHVKALAVSAYKEQGNELININADFMVIIMTKIILVMVINVFIFN